VVRARLRLVAALGATLLIVGTLGWMWWSSLVPSTYSVMEMGYLDYGGGTRPPIAGHGMAGHGMTGHGMAGMSGTGHGNGGESRSVTDLDTDPDRPADVTVDLTARQQRFTLPTGEEIDGYTLNGSSPGPLITATVGELVEVHLHNASVPDGVTLHWHGVDVPNAEDGVAGVTQDAVPVGGDFTYRFVVPHAGTFWYHSHQVSHDQVVGGLLGPLVVQPRHRDTSVRDVVALAHLYGGAETVNGHAGHLQVDAEPGEQVRLRVINTDNGPLEIWSGEPLTLVATDGYDVHGPTPFTGRTVDVPAGGRADVLVAVADGGTRVQLTGDVSVVLGPDGARPPSVEQPERWLDRLHYGTPEATPLMRAKADRSFRYDIGHRLGFVDGRPGLQWSINGHLFPDLPMFVVEEGDVVRIRISNHSGDVHPMHLHGHHAVVLDRDGDAVSGSPWWVDSLDVRNGETYDIAFLADNPGIWMDHCHNLTHAAQGMVTHLMYAGVTEPFRIGGGAGNEPE
jgi:FtsP/CotA-like multicopper oxidase with cupredoxin domain